MEKPFGIRASLEPHWLFDDFSDEFYDGQFQLWQHQNVLEIGYECEADEAEARWLAERYINGQNLKSDFKITITINQTWRRRDDVAELGVGVSDRLLMADAVSTDVRSSASISVASSYDSRSLRTTMVIAGKARRHPELALALKYFSDEVAGSGRPLYGIYKAIEVLVTKVQAGLKLARKKNDKKAAMQNLGALANRNWRWVDEVCETAQVERHSQSAGATPARRLVSDEECRQRTRLLIEAYSNSLV